MIQQPIALSQLMIRKSKSVTTKTKGKIAVIINNKQIETLSSALQIIFQQFSSAPMSMNINTSTTTKGKNRLLFEHHSACGKNNSRRDR
jgi:hypothetical protein